MRGGMFVSMHDVMKQIVRCPLVTEALENSGGQCSVIVRSQNNLDRNYFQVPEPWRGHIDTAPILFVSSNPGIKYDEDFPTLNWDLDSTEAFFTSCFDKDSKFTKDGKKYLMKNGEYSPNVRFWINIRNRANELIENAIPGKDYALTEVVHCKSQNETVMHEALETCTKNYLKSVISLSTAKVIIVLGSVARISICSNYGISLNKDESSYGPVKIENIKRYIAFLPHPNARVSNHKLSNNLNQEKLQEIRDFLRT